MEVETDLADDLPEVEDVAEELEEQDESEATEEEGDSEEEEATEPDLADVEIDGKTYKVPAELKDNFMLRADYTRKTQEVADQRRALETAITEVKQASDDELNVRATIVAVDAALAQYANVDWNQLEAQDFQAAQSHFRNYTMLQQQRTNLDTELSGAVQRREAEAQRVTAERLQQGIAELERDIPGWSAAKAVTLMEFGEKQFGFSRQYLENVTDPKFVKLMHTAYVAMQAKPKQPAQAPAKPAAKVKGGSIPKAGLDDRLSTEEWMRRRNAQANRR